MRMFAVFPLSLPVDSESMGTRETGAAIDVRCSSVGIPDAMVLRNSEYEAIYSGKWRVPRTHCECRY